MEYSELARLFPSLYQETKSKIKNVYGGINQYSELFKKLDLLNESQSDNISFLSADSSKRKIPNVLHFTWLGDKPLPEEFKQNISYFSKGIKELGGISVLWIDQMDIEPSVRLWLKECSIHLINVGTVFGSPETMTTFYHFKSALAKIPSNFGEASDLLRYEIVDRFGGYYLDCDVKKESVNLEALILKGNKAPYGFICGQSSDKKGHCRNDLFGAVPQCSLMKKIKDLALKNYREKALKNYVEYKRPLLTDFTVFTTGPEVFNEAIEQFLSQGKKLSDEQKREIARNFLIPSKVGTSAESWVYNHTNLPPVNFPNEQSRRDRIKHDLMLNLINEEKILDLEKYQAYLKSNDQEWLISIIEELIQGNPELIDSIDRIFIGNFPLYSRLQKLLEKRLKKPIEWNQLATLKFACVMRKNDLIRFLIENKNLNPFDATFADVGYYDCSFASPFGILLETGNLEIVKEILNSSEKEVLKENNSPIELGLIYAGDKLWTAAESISSIPKMKITQIKRLMREKSIQQCEGDIQIERFQALQQLIHPFFDQL